MAHVLVVDDDEPIRDALRALLEDAGHTVDEAPSGAPALERLKRSGGGLVVLLDVNMPGTDGIQVMRAVSEQNPLAPRHAYIIMTATARTLPMAFVNQLAEMRAPIVTKPFDADELLDAIDRAAHRVS
jgi:CheY-like chemotaxis protein